MVRQILLRGGTLLQHSDDDHVKPSRADLLIENDRIKEIKECITLTDSMRVIDCKGKIISPGFIDTHHHLWQSQQKGTHADQLLLDYYHSGNLASSHYTPEDIFWGELACALELVDAGTTTVVDHAHLNYSPDHNKEALRALVSSGVRAIFCYSAHPRVATWRPGFALEKNILPDWVMATFSELASRQTFGPNGRVCLGFAADTGFFAATELKEIFATARSEGAHLITSHGTKMAMLNIPSTTEFLAKHKLLGPDVLISHANKTTPEELIQLQSFGVHLSSTPAVEMQMGHGHPICLQPGFLGISSLGVDCHSVCNSFLPSQMLLVLQASRARHMEEASAKNEQHVSVGPTAKDVYNLGTILGARAVGLENDIGSLKAGKKADIIIFDGRTPAMISASDNDPVSAIVFHSSVRDVETVIIDGVIRKEGSSLSTMSIPLDLHVSDTNAASEQTLEWEDVAVSLDRNRTQMKQRTCDIDRDDTRKGLIRTFIDSFGNHAR